MNLTLEAKDYVQQKLQKVAERNEILCSWNERTLVRCPNLQIQCNLTKSSMMLWAKIQKKKKKKILKFVWST
jgi:hypothetical protein